MSDNRIDQLIEQKKKLEERIRLIRNREKQKDRKLDTRKKILLGAAVLSKVKKGHFSHEEINQILDEELIAEKDRIVFNLPVKAAKPRKASA